MKKKIKDSDLNRSQSRDTQLEKLFNIKPIEAESKEEWVKIPLDLPWEDLAKDVALAFDKFGWYGMVHRMDTDWNRSKAYGGLGLTHNPDYVYNIPEHAQGWGQPRSTSGMDSTKWIEALESYNYTDLRNDRPLFNTYDDPLGLRVLNPITEFRSFKKIFDMVKMPVFQGRIAQLKASELKHSTPERMEMVWHTDEPNHLVSRLLIPLVWDENYYIEFKETGNRMYFEPGYAYHFDTYKVHRFNFDYKEGMVDRTCLILGWSPYLEFDGEYWTTNEHTNKIAPRDMILRGMVI